MKDENNTSNRRSKDSFDPWKKKSPNCVLDAESRKKVNEAAAAAYKRIKPSIPMVYWLREELVRVTGWSSLSLCPPKSFQVLLTHFEHL